ncbi:MAG: hypothetical protein DI551_06390 [Micavibrio aeruginosavorus]|uniref:Rap1a immunity protein domain-containing protein n=1 Tax=Micavibrio aeruginosavorus TaxID=349221 RepID=A0A2W5N4T9_9BACT|nr:MAG: hypothetical protein DI551_06390 [Micavibrio aeruginosavorus]
MLALLFPFSADAQQNSAGMFSGSYLHELCRSDAKGKEMVKGGHTACQAYIAGVIDYHKLMKSLGTAPVIDFCVPNTIPMRHLQNIVWVYLAKNPQNGEFLAAPAVTLALYEYFPCRVAAPSSKSKKKYKR